MPVVWRGRVLFCFQLQIWLQVIFLELSYQHVRAGERLGWVGDGSGRQSRVWIVPYPGAPSSFVTDLLVLTKPTGWLSLILSSKLLPQSCQRLQPERLVPLCMFHMVWRRPSWQSLCVDSQRQPVHRTISGDSCLLGTRRVRNARHFIRPRNTFAKEKSTVIMNAGRRKCGTRRQHHAAEFHSY